MKKLLSLKLACILLFSALSTLGPVFTSPAMAETNTCENGECVDDLIDKLQDLGSAYQKECLPSEGMKVDDIKVYYEEHGLTERCWKLITEINHLENLLQGHQNRLEERLGCQSGECKLNHQDEGLNSQIAALTKVEQNLSCTEPKKQEIRNKCPQDLQCVLAATALGMGGYVAEMLLPAKAKPKDCHLGDDSCMTQLATGFLKAVVSFFEGAWDLLKLAGKKAGEKMTQFWNWVSGAEDHSSTSQLAMAKASQDPGVFDMLIKDFPGTMKKIWSAFVGSMKEWLKTDIFCQKWSGVPHFSKCLKPTESFDCIPCKTMVTGLCGISGTLVAEIVPAFLTGGLTTAAKYGAQGAVKIAKMFRISSKGMKLVKESRVAKIAISAAAKADEALKITRGLRIAKVAVEGSLLAIRKYLLSPSRKVMKETFNVLTHAVKKGSAYVAETKAGKVLIFSGKATKLAGKIVIYPIDNPMTTFAFKAGQRTFEKAFKLGAPKLAEAGAVASTVVRHESTIESVLTKVEETRLHNPKNVAKVEQELLAKIEPKRRALLEEALKNEDADFSEIVRHLYPELQYGDLAKTLPKEKILAAEKEVFLEIQKMPEGPAKTALTKRYQKHVVQGEARAKIIPDDSPTYKKVIDNSQLKDDERFSEAMKLLKRKPVSPEEQKKLSDALKKAHLVGDENGVFEYSWSELREKYQVLVDGGFSKEEADLLIRHGLAGRPPVREIVNPGKTLFSGFAEDIVEGKYLEKREELQALLKGLNPEEKKGLMGKLMGWMGKGTSNAGVDAQKISDNLESLYFIDYSHSVNELDNILQGSKVINKSEMAARYEQNAFNNFKGVRQKLLTEKPEVSKETLLNIHKDMMKGGVENVTDAQRGLIRDGSWYGNVPDGYGLDESIVTELKANKYLTWEETGKQADGKLTGKIWYPNPDKVSKEALDLLRAKNPQLVAEIEEYQALAAKLAKADPSLPADELAKMKARYAELTKIKSKQTQRLVDALVDHEMEWFNMQRAKIGNINSPEKLDEYVDLVAEFQRNLVSIHPLANGNGRSTRELMSWALMKEGFPPPRVLDPNADIYRSLNDWRKMIKHGILASDFLMDDVIERLKFGLPIENSVDLITPYTRPPVKMGLKGAGKGAIQMEGVEYVDPRLYREIVKREMKLNPALKTEFEKNPVAAWDKMNKKVEETFSKNNVYYNHPKKGLERLEIGYVDEDFKLLYGKPSFDNKELFDFKMKTWYSDEVTWRGLASKTHEKSEAEIVQMFEQLTSHNASNAVLGKIRGSSDPEVIRKAALEDFEKYNNDVFGDGLVQMAKDHSETGPMYGISYGYSTSKNRDVGKAFAQGAMVIGKYGEHKAPELQALLKSRVLVGARRANKDVDLGRLKQLRDDFSYKYGRQQEVMGVGASDPDAITIVQTLDANGDVMLSYLRNKNNPKEIFVVKGAIEPDAVPTSEQIVKTITLQKKP